MPDIRSSFRRNQKSIEFHFQTVAGVELMDPQKIFRATGESYRVETPVIEGYLLVSNPEPVNRIMGESSVSLELTYDRIGSVRIYQGTDDVIGEEIELLNSEQPNRVRPITLPDVSNKKYYPMDEIGIGDAVVHTENFVPETPTKQTLLLCLTDDEVHELRGDINVSDIVIRNGTKIALDKNDLGNAAIEYIERVAESGNTQSRSTYFLQQAIVNNSKALLFLNENKAENREIIAKLLSSERDMLNAIKLLLKQEEN